MRAIGHRTTVTTVYPGAPPTWEDRACATEPWLWDAEIDGTDAHRESAAARDHRHELATAMCHACPLFYPCRGLPAEELGLSGIVGGRLVQTGPPVPVLSAETMPCRRCSRLISARPRPPVLRHHARGLCSRCYSREQEAGTLHEHPIIGKGRLLATHRQGKEAS